MEESDDQSKPVIDDGAAENGLVYRFDGTRFAEKITVTPHDFCHSAVLSLAESSRLQQLHQNFAGHLSTRLSAFLRMDCSAQLVKFETPTYASFVESLESPAAVALLQIEPLLGLGILNLSLPLCHAIIDRLLGGRGIAATAERSLSEIEIALLEDAIQVVMDEWCLQWHTETKLQPRCLGHETSARSLKTSLPDAIVLTAAIEIQLGESHGHLQLGMPYSMVEAMVKEMQERESIRRGAALNKKLQWRPAYGEIVVPVVAEWQVRQVRIQELLSLAPGDVLPMDSELINRTRVQLANDREFIGQVGVQNGRVAVQLTKQFALE